MGGWEAPILLATEPQLMPLGSSPINASSPLLKGCLPNAWNPSLLHGSSTRPATRTQHSATALPTVVQHAQLALALVVFGDVAIL